MKKMLFLLSVGIVLHTALLADVSPTQSSEPAPIYLKADATGDGSGSDWANAMSNVYEAVEKSDETGRPVYAARGLYKYTKTATVDLMGVKIYGGFCGISEDETLESRDPDKYQTIVVPDLAVTKLGWNYVTPVIGECRLTVTELDVEQYPVFKTNEEGYPVFAKPALPYQNDYDGFCLNTKKTGNSSKVRFLTIKELKGAVIDGITFVGSSDYMISVNSKTDPNNRRIVKDCRFYGTQAINTEGANTGLGAFSVEVLNCEFRYTHEMTVVIRQYCNRMLIEDCVFSEHFRSENDSALVTVSYRHLSMRRCAFSRCAAISKVASEYEKQYTMANLFKWGQDSQLLIVDCVMTNNFSGSLGGYGHPLFSGKSDFVSGCYVANNRLEYKGVSGRCFSLVAEALRTGTSAYYYGCTFESNSVVEIDGKASNFSAGIVGNGYELTQSLLGVYNCTFVDNHLSVKNPQTANAVLSQGVLFHGLAAKNSRFTAVNCAFIRTDGDNSLYDIAQVETAVSDYRILNSIFSRGPAACYNPFYAKTPEKMIVRKCSIGGRFEAPQWLNIDDVQLDAVPFERIVTSTGNVVYRPACKMPALRDCINVFSNNVTFAAAEESSMPPRCVTYKIRTDDGKKWIPLLGDADKATYQNGTIGDALGNDRPSDSFTRGPIQTLSDTAEAGNTLIVRSEPLGAGQFSPSHCQVVAPDAQSVTVTASGRYELEAFSKWLLPNGQSSTDATLTFGPLVEGITVITGQFTVSTVDVTFDLGDYGVFADGTNIKTLQYKANSRLTIPAISDSEEYVFLGWVNEPPILAPISNATYTATGITKALRVFRVVPADDAVAEGGKGDGSSWEDAYRGDIHEAYTQAGVYRGEVWLKKGVYDATEVIQLRSNVALLGGFAGTETDAKYRDPKKNVTVITGDTNRDNYYTLTGAVAGENAKLNVFDYENMVFNEPSCKPTKTRYWKNNGGNAEDVFSSFVGGGYVTNCVIDGVSFVGFARAAINVPVEAELRLTRSRILACNTSQVRDMEIAGVVVYGTLHAEDCDFMATYTPLSFLDAGAAYTKPNSLVNCRFMYGYHHPSGNGGGLVVFTDSRDITIEKCRFAYNAGWQYSGYQNAPIAIRDVNNLTMRDCIIEENAVSDSCPAIMQVSSVDNRFVMERCIFRNNVKDGTGGSPSNIGSPLRIDSISLNPGNVIRDTLFEGNITKEESAAAPIYVRHASAIAFTRGILNLVCCSFINNTLDLKSAHEDSLGSTVLFACLNNDRSLMSINNVYTGNRILNYKHKSDVAFGFGAAKNDYGAMFINDVYDCGDNGYEGIMFPSNNVGFMAANCRFPGYSAGKYYTTADSFDVGNSTKLPNVAGKIAKGANGVYAVPVRGVNAQGAPIYIGSDNVYYAYLPQVNPDKPYWGLLSKRANWSVAAVPGMENGKAEINKDAWGAPPISTRNRPSLGPVNLVNGFYIHLR